MPIGGSGGRPKGDPGGSPQPFSSVSDDQDKLLEGLLEPNASDSSDILACKGPNNGFQLALGVRLASRFPIQVENMDPPRRPARVTGGNMDRPKRPHRAMGLKKKRGRRRTSVKHTLGKLFLLLGRGHIFLFLKKEKFWARCARPNLNLSHTWEGTLQTVCVCVCRRLCSGVSPKVWITNVRRKLSPV